ncbi:MAG TPA: hypothetical protein VG935_04775 [Patescibacteria group bacterium]|nr:hypothetical protein [Patescibacteria group bacterium]
MNSFILTGSEGNALKQKTLDLCTEKAIDPFDITIISLQKESLGIEIVKKLKEKAFLKPLKGKDKAVIIPQAELLTIPAQNALLKLLEEPPEHTYLFLLTQSPDNLLPTIRSRCQVIKTQEPEVELNREQQEKIDSEFASWEQITLAEALKKAEHLAKDKEQTLNFLRQALLSTYQTLHKTNATEKTLIKTSIRLRTLLSTYQILLTTNTSPRLTLEHFFLSLLYPQTHQF